MKEEREQRKKDRKQVKKRESQQRSRINKAFKKIPRFDGTNPSYCFNWLEQTEALVNEHHRRIYREELLLNCGTSVSKTIHALPQGAANQSIKDTVLRNHSNLRTVSQRSKAYHQLHQKPDEALQSYNTRYASFFNLAYPELELDNPLSRMHCIHYASSLYGKLGDEMTGSAKCFLPVFVHRIVHDTFRQFLCSLLVFLFLTLSCPKRALVWGNGCERLRVEIFVRVLRSSRVKLK